IAPPSNGIPGALCLSRAIPCPVATPWVRSGTAGRFEKAKAPMVPACLALKNNPAMVTQDKVATAITTGSYPNLQCCDECRLYADFDSLPPCFCDVNEGL
uniref:Uncharacterized protein n=1 Tax=Equus asinus TaxID=9793 RepID=A0A9L0IZV5_EQUAS